MTLLKRTLLMAALTVGLLAGCSTPQQHKVDVNKKWQVTRAQVACGAAAAQYQTGRLDQARARAQEALTLDADSADARLLLAKIDIEQGNYADAVRGLTALIQTAPKAGELHYLLGVAHERGGQLEAALADYRKSQALASSGADAAVAAGEVLVQLGRLDEAAKYVEGYAASNAQDVAVLELAARIAMHRHDYDSAIARYQQALELSPRTAGYAESLAQAQMLAGRHNDALRTAQELLSQPNYKSPAWLHALVGECHLALNRPADARDAFIAATDASPSLAQAWAGLAQANLALNDVPRAILAARQALAADESHRGAAMALAYALLRSGQAQEALGVLTQPAIASGGADVLRQCLLGRAYAASGRTEEARRCYASALEIEPQNALAQGLLASLN